VYRRIIFALIARKEARFFGVDSYSSISASAFYKLREIEHAPLAFFALDPARARSARDRAYGSGIRKGEEDAKSADHGAASHSCSPVTNSRPCITSPVMNTGVAVLIIQALCSGTRGLNASSHQHKSFPQRAGKVHGQCGKRRPRNRMSCSHHAIGSCFGVSNAGCRCSCSRPLTRRKASNLGHAGAKGASAEAHCQ
jgi:hypothetical protein